MDVVPDPHVHRAGPPPDWRRYVWKGVVFFIFRMVYRYSQVPQPIPAAQGDSAWNSCQINLLGSESPADEYSSSTLPPCPLSKEQEEVALKQVALLRKHQFALLTSCYHYIPKCCSPLLSNPPDPCDEICPFVRNNDIGKSYCALVGASNDQTCTPTKHFDYSKKNFRLDTTTEVDRSLVKWSIFVEMHHYYSQKEHEILAFPPRVEENHRMVSHSTPV
ncbi:hypothetical protein M758_8G048900 [Ceratodon purpureus]|nr:hypothetical protein M758_8G048900 [Ceratodon purpureus]